MEEHQGQWQLAKQTAVGIVAAAVVIFIGFHRYLAYRRRCRETGDREASGQFLGRHG